MTREYRVISADSHLEVAGDRWAARVPAKYRDLAPRRVKLPNGGEVQVMGSQSNIEPRRTFRKGYDQRAGTFEDNDGAGTPEKRLQEQDEDGIDAEVLFPGTNGCTKLLRNGLTDDEAYKAMVRAYNDWLAEDYCSVAPDRLIGVGLLPEVDLDSAIDELEHCARLGLKGVQLDAFPSAEVYPTPEDDRFYAACVDMNMPLCAHIGLHQSRGGEIKPLFKYSKSEDTSLMKSTGRDPITKFMLHGRPPSRDIVRLVFAGVFDRFPTLNMYFAETQAGWVPYWLERLDDAYHRDHPFAHEVWGLPKLDRLPSEIVKEHIWWGFTNDGFGVESRYHIGVDHMMWESDFPHDISSFPHSCEVIDTIFKGVPEDERAKMLAKNCTKFFHLDEVA